MKLKNLVRIMHSYSYIFVHIPLYAIHSLSTPFSKVRYRIESGDRSFPLAPLREKIF
jgi:hypothetical protein